MNLEIVDDLKQPEYTGENRCEPCTVLNLAIAAVVGSVVARKTKLGGLLAIGVSIGLIYLRGYLVPGTPTLTKRYLPPEVLRWFGKEPDPEPGGGFGGIDSTAVADDASSPPESTAAGSTSAGSDNGETTSDSDPDDADVTDSDVNAGQPALDLETYFLESDVLEPCEDRDDLCLTDEFETVWFEEIEAVDEAGIDVATVVDAVGFDADPEEFDLESPDEVYQLVTDGGIAGRWPSRAALLADVAAARALESWMADWDAYDPETRGQVLSGLRMFLERCPTGGAVSMSEEVVESCCTSHDVFAVTCEETGERLFEQRLDAVDV
ncbi:hypothetical protein RBH26_07370 [Natronolimnohabitans sp. A-GB9]|uniref:hypothetical protein n=1 Tax=Natronolimnohabitans sp. A-GB9 TaxID=3069757 RepID=UPI0027B1D34B|nr:hypothetical protein [Natronolimnohabitans sp. A-GB9]MDQ2050303.1 hypothetical protein [Natronolimnohabitans sp. A-GB9]